MKKFLMFLTAVVIAINTTAVLVWSYANFPDARDMVGAWGSLVVLLMIAVTALFIQLVDRRSGAR